MRRAAVSLFALAVLLCAAASQHVTKILPRPDRPAELVRAHVLPDPKLTPGAVYSDVTLADIQKSGFSATDRNVTESEKKQVFKEYGYDLGKIDTGDFEVDHLIELACGGSNDIHNLWPQPLYLNVHGLEMGAREKDKLERKLLAEVRAGHIPMKQAQEDLAKDWTVLYRELVAPEFPAAGKH